jgi:hypothetical protein
MFVVNEDLSIYCTRGDCCEFPVKHQFKKGDVVRFKATRKKDCETVVIQRDFEVETETDEITISLTGEDTKIGEVISKPTDYWYEVELNPDTHPQTIIGYDEDGAKVFKLFPEGKDVDAEDIEVVGKKTLQELVDYALEQARDSGEFDGVSVTHEWDGTTLEVTSASGTSSADLKGERGNPGVYVGEEEPTDPEVSVWINPISEETKFVRYDEQNLTKEEKAQARKNIGLADVANTLKGSASGEAVALKDVSPIEHEIAVKVDVPGAKVTKYGKNIFNASKLLTASGWSVDENGVYSGNSGALRNAYPNATRPFMTFEGVDRLTLSFRGYFAEGQTPAGLYFRFEYDDGSTETSAVRDATDTYYSFTTKEGAIPKTLYFSYGNAGGMHYLRDIQIEVGTTATEYEPYKEPITYTAGENGVVNGIVGNGEGMTIFSESGVTISAEYNKDTNKVIESLVQAIISLGGNV